MKRIMILFGIVGVIFISGCSYPGDEICKQKANGKDYQIREDNMGTSCYVDGKLLK